MGGGGRGSTRDIASLTPTLDKIILEERECILGLLRAEIEQISSSRSFCARMVNSCVAQHVIHRRKSCTACGVVGGRRCDSRVTRTPPLEIKETVQAQGKAFVWIREW